MKILFDQGTPVPLRRFLEDHEVHTVFEKGWDRLSNGDVLAVAILNGYEVLISTDQNLRQSTGSPPSTPRDRGADDHVVATDQSKHRSSGHGRCTRTSRRSYRSEI